MSKNKNHDIFIHIHEDIKFLFLRKNIKELCNRPWVVIIIISRHLIKLRQNILKFTLAKKKIIKFISLYTKKRTHKKDFHAEVHRTTMGTSYLRYLLISLDFNSQESYLTYPALSCYD